MMTDYWLLKVQNAMNESVNAIALGKLKVRFAQLWSRCLVPKAIASPDPVWAGLLHHYNGPDRYYHTLRHISHCLKQLDIAKRHLQSLDTVEMALWFHDIICLAGAKDNEKQSANFFKELAGSSFERSFTNRVSYLIISTMHNAIPRDGDERFIRDIDLSSFALPWEEFIRDTRAIRAEHTETPDELFFTAKIKYLNAMLERPAIYLTKVFYDRCEKAARQNIRRCIAVIQEGRLG